MASLRIPFPEREGHSVVLLRGPLVTVGRKPDNTIQIAHRTISSRHAEFISECGYYRLHDAGSTNGVFVDDMRVTDYHLTKPCTIRFGEVEIQFSPDPAAHGPDVSTDLVPTFKEVQDLRMENRALLSKVEALQAELAELRQTASASEGPCSPEYYRVVAERTDLKVLLHKRELELEAVRRDYSILERDRDAYRAHFHEASHKLATRNGVVRANPGLPHGATVQAVAVGTPKAPPPLPAVTQPAATKSRSATMRPRAIVSAHRKVSSGKNIQKPTVVIQPKVVKFPE